MSLKFAYLGAWHSHAPMHLREAAAHPDEFELTGFYDADSQVIQRNLERWREYGLLLHVFEEISELLASDANAVIIEGHVYENLDYAEQALNADKHVLLEKPAGVDLAHLAQLHDLARRRGLFLQMAYMWRYNPAVYEMLRLVRADALGQIFQYRGHIPKPLGWHPQLAQEFSAYHGGVYFEMAGHLIDLMVAVIGTPTAVWPVLGRHFGNRREVDNAVVVHECESGIGTIDTTAMQAGMDRRVEVHGTEGTAIHAPIGSDHLSLYLTEDFEQYRNGWQELELKPEAHSPSLLRELAACIRGEKEPDYSLDHDMTVQRILLQGCGITDGNALRRMPSSR